MLLFFFVSAALSVALIVLNSLMGKKDSKQREKISSFECGFDPKSLARLPFSLHFFLIALIFLIFDVEITLILPFPILMSKSYSSTMFFLFLFFVLVLTLGVFLEWKDGALDWSK
uniref:NADH-ubiquinone oxidoreductase chain 3 n=1 Tax=Sminthurides bifidus TaxID=2584528 RepID=A0A6H0EYT8_9HEXA|nr:NADH dehydrogenase subunit 3 [Sminthurides bifidus]